MLAQVVLAFEPQLGLLRGFAGSLTAALIASMSRPQRVAVSNSGSGFAVSPENEYGEWSRCWISAISTSQAPSCCPEALLTRLSIGCARGHYLRWSLPPSPSSPLPE